MMPSKQASQAKNWQPSWRTAVFLTLVVALAFQGTRGIWEPDEGFYSNVAAGMQATGDYWIPRLNGEVFLDKPPLLYWTLSWGQSILGSNEWGARVGHAMWFFLTALVVGALSAEMWGRRLGPSGALRYSLALGPFIAANVLTPDTPLTFCVAMMGWATWRLSGDLGSGKPSLVNGCMFGLAAGLGVLAKGPALLVFALPMLFFLWARHGRRMFAGGPMVAVVLASTLGLAWYIWIGASVSGAAEYMFDNQVRGRLWSGHYRRNGDLFGPIRVYLPVLLAGSLPWTFSLFRAAKRALQAVFRLRSLRDLVTLPRRAPQAAFLVSSIVLPIAVLSLARSRLPLYVLPAFPLLIILAAKEPLNWTRRQVAAWGVLLLSIKLLASIIPVETDSRRMAQTLDSLGVVATTPLVAVEDKRNGLAFYGFENLQWVKIWAKSYPYFSPPRALEAFISSEPLPDRIVFIVREELLPELQARLPVDLLSCKGSDPRDSSVVLDCHNVTGRETTLAKLPEVGR